MKATGWIPGEWRAVCDICGFEFLASELRENYRKQRVCKDDFETRHPQEVLRVKKEVISVPWSRPATDGYAGATYTGPISDTIDWSVQTSHNVYVDATSGDVTLDLGSPTATTLYSNRVQVSRTDASSHVVTITGTGISSTTIAALQGVIFVTNGSTWQLFGKVGG